MPRCNRCKRTIDWVEVEDGYGRRHRVPIDPKPTRMVAIGRMSGTPRFVDVNPRHQTTCPGKPDE
jgi:hypothetical protein